MVEARIREPNGRYHKPRAGTPQGGVISPVLANIYLHYALDLWFEKKIKPTLKGRAMLIRYADDFVVAFQYWREARAFYGQLPSRLKQFNKASLRSFYSWIKASRHRRLAHWMVELKRKLTGFRNYFALPDNSLSMSRLYDHVLKSLYIWLNRRSGRKSYTWTGMKAMLGYYGIQPLRVYKRHIAVDWY